MDLSIIIVNFNTRELLKECLKSLFTIHRSLITNHEIIVVDNASTDGSIREIQNLKIKYQNENSKIKIILNKKNLGFAKAVNQGISKAEGSYIFLLNPDTRVKENSLNELIEFAKNHPEAGVVGARLVNPSGLVQPSVYHFPSLCRAIREYWLGQKGSYEKYAPKGKKPIEVEAVTGAAMLIPRETIKRIGLLDERYFMYFEDLDFCRRVRKAGFKVYFLPEAEIIHHHGKSAEKTGAKAYQYLCQSSKIFNGLIKYYLLSLIIWIGQKWQKVVGEK